MRCHICGEPATGQCQTCWKFYCSSHGDVVCENCKGSPRRRSPQGPTGATATFSTPQVPADLEDPNVRAILRGGLARNRVLRGVLAIADVRHTERADLSLLSLESYDDGFTLHWRINRTPPQPEDLTAHPFGGTHPSLLLGSAQDDLGAEYSGWLGGGSGQEHDWRGELEFIPAIADAGTRLKLRIEEIQWMSLMPGVRSSAEIGPWTFEIQLANLKAVSP